MKVSFLLLSSSIFGATQAGAFSTRQTFGGIRALSTVLGVSKSDLLGAQEAIDEILFEKACGPIFVRLGEFRVLQGLKMFE